MQQAGVWAKALPFVLRPKGVSMRINELKAILANIDQTIADQYMVATMGRLCRYVMFKNSDSGLGYDLNLSLDSLHVTYFIAKDDIYKTKSDIHFITPKQYLIVREWLNNLIINGKV